jgi:hypothetical protein
MARPRHFSREGVLGKSPSCVLEARLCRRLAVHELAGMVMTFFAGLSVEQNLKSSRASFERKVDNLMQVLRSL